MDPGFVRTQIIGQTRNMKAEKFNKGSYENTSIAIFERDTNAVLKK